jgi:hypothetical protein
MSTSEEHNSPEAEAPEDEEMEAEASEPMEPPQLTEDKNGAGATIFLFFILGFVASLIVGWVVFPKLLYSKKKQPLNFNHALHVAEVEEECESCHYFREDGSFSGVPTISHCIECHEDVNGEDPEEEKFVREYVEAGKEVPWLIYSKQPASVFFSHAAHLKTAKAKMECVTCHGPIGESTKTRIYEENRLTGYSRDIWGKNISGIKQHSWERMKMDDCSDCHMQKATSEKESGVQQSLTRQLREMVSVAFPNVMEIKKGSSVQTEKDACFVCHK